MPDGNPAAAQSWHRRRPVRAAGIVLLVTAVSALVLLVHYWPFTQASVASSIEDTFPGKISFQHFRGTWFPSPGCIVDGVVFRPQGNSRDSGTVISIRRAVVRAHYWDLLLRPGYVAGVTLEGLRVQVPPAGSRASLRNPNGSRATLGEVVADGAVLEI